MGKYIVKDSYGNTMRVFTDYKQASNYKYAWGNMGWSITIKYNNYE